MRRKYSNEEIIAAQNLRKAERYSFAELQKITGIPATTIRNWCKDDVYGTKWDTLLLSNARKRNLIKLSESSSISNIPEFKENAKIYASLLYWCEGAKYPSSNKVIFTNSDSTLVKLFLQLLRISFPLNESKFRVHLQLHSIHLVKETQVYWSRLLKIPITQFMKPTITEMKGGKHRREYSGTCSLRYSDYRILLKLTGIYERFSDQFVDSTI